MKVLVDCTVEGQAGRSEAPCDEESVLPFPNKKADPSLLLRMTRLKATVKTESA
jgi:hypothetical protein